MLAVHHLALCILVLAAVATAQQPNSADARLLLNGMGTNGPWPVAAGLAHTGALGTVQLTSAAATTPVPFALAFGHLAVGHMSFGAQSLDLDTSACGFSVVMNGFDPGHPFQSWSWLATQFQVTVWFPNAFGGPAAMQACVAVPTAPQGFVLTAAADLFSGGPVLGAVGPNAGTAGGGMQVVLSGTNFQCDPPVVLFGTTPAVAVQVLSDQLITCITPVLPVGVHAISLTQAHGSSVLPAAFTAQPGNPLFTTTEDFNDQLGRDSSFVPVFVAAGWNSAAQPGVLAGAPLSGSALASFNGNPAGLGTRIQVAVEPLPAWSGGVFSPFDTPTNNLGAGTNPNGGSRTMHLYEAVDLGMPRASLELVEWGPYANAVFGAVYPGFQMWCGQTTRSAPIAPPYLQIGLNAVFQANYDQATHQAPDPAHVNPSTNALGGVKVLSLQPYTTSTVLAPFFPFPVLSPCFDYLGSGAGAGALIIEQIAAPNAVTVLNLNRLHAANFTPLRRIIAGPANNIAAFGGLEVYHQRFTFVGLEASARSVFKDCGVPAIQSAQYLACVVTPPLASQPAGSATKLEFEGATAIVGPNQALGATTGWMTYAQGNAPAVSIDPLVLSNPVISAPQLSGRRFYRFRCTLRANNLTNQVPSIDRIDMLASW